MNDRILGRLAVADGAGVLRMQDRYDTDPADLWSALTDPARLSRWYADVQGDLHVGGEHRMVVHASGWEGVGWIEVCEPPQRLVVRSQMDGDSSQDVLTLTLTPEGDGTLLELEQRNLPVRRLAGYGAGTQVHLEDLAAHLAGRGRCDADARWAQLEPRYDELAAELDVRPLLAALRGLDGSVGAVRVEDVYDTDVEDLWDACTDPSRLARWIADVSGDLRVGGRIETAFTSGGSGTGRIDVCERPHHLLVTMLPGTADEQVIEAWLTAEGDKARLVVEDRGIPLTELPLHGAGWHAHLEDLGRSLAGDGSAWQQRWSELAPLYRDASIG